MSEQNDFIKAETVITDDDVNRVGVIQASPVFVTVDDLDAAAIIHVGGTATTYTRLTDAQIEKLGDALRVASEVRADGHTAAGYLDGDYKQGIDHAADMDVKELARAVKTIMREVKQPYNAVDYLAKQFLTDMEKWKSGCVPTGFAKLDKLLGGGLHDGLYVIAAGTSVGKTTFAWQLADQLAEHGSHVMYWSLEMSRRELVLKSLSRITQISTQDLSNKDGCFDALIDATSEWERKIGDRLQIVEGNLNTDIRTIETETKRYAEAVKKPVVIVDYLQIIKPRRERPAARQELDETVSALKIMSRDLGIPVIVISSINRMNYLAPMDYSSLKETGGIEFTSDCIIGLQLECVHDSEFAKKNVTEQREKYNTAKAANPRQIRLSGLKNRGGVGTFDVCMEYNPETNTFKETGQAPKKAVMDWNSPIEDAPKPTLVQRGGRSK